MGKVIAGMTMSLDGYVADADGKVDRLYPDFMEMSESAVMSEIVKETGAVIMGRKMFEMGAPDAWSSYEFQVPIFVVTTHPPAVPPPPGDRLTFTFVGDGVASAVAQAKAAAGEKSVQVVGGAGLIQELLRQELVDELSIDIMPVLLSGGARLFEGEGLDRIGLELTKVATMGQRTSFTIRVAR